ncbi:type VI secretion system protein TssA [Chitinimonas viridis]|uniref:Type VI secretion system protein TssA n=1 Tax=Chitinimonas viridis TaxID=664880 RepID=A0ABT8BAP2_9NEIS|nr:type VI secretion system protein TssA [Chitinimonas viridis]MDN3579213.1 type VI secretion system protein TssA [Chitinimonas viridis]
MSHIDLAALLAPVADAQPCGDNLEYSAEFLALEAMAGGTPEQQFGDTIIAAVAPDWLAVARQAQEMLARSKDLRIAGFLVRAATRNSGLQGLAQGLSLVADLLAQYWPDLHPELEDGDATMRVNALSVLASAECLQADVRQSVYLEVRGLSSCLVRDAEITLSGRAEREGGLQEADLVRLVQADPAQAQAVAELLTQILASLAVITSQLDDNAPYHGLDFQPLRRLLQALQLPLKAVTGDTAPAADETAEGSTQPTEGAPVSHAPAGQWPQSVNSRQEAARLVELACSYFERHEPGHPAPLLLRRGQKLMTMDFLEIMRELAPEGLGQIEMVAGLNR